MSEVAMAARSGRTPLTGTPRPLLELDRVFRSYQQGGNRLDVLRGVTLTVGHGELVALVGPSGAGKSTLLHLAGLLERPDAGDVLITGKRCGRMSDRARTELRRSVSGFVYQFHHLLPEFNALENVVLPQMIAGTNRKAALQRANELLRLVGLAARATHRPAQLSGGEQQRVAIARALANAPQILIADEPTGNLDHHTADEVFDVLAKLVRSTETGALVATHNLDLAYRMDRILELRDGVLVPHDRSD